MPRPRAHATIERQTVVWMKTWIKIVLGVIAAVALVIVLTLAALLVFFDPNDYKPQIDAAIQRQIGRNITIDGPIRLSVFPWLGVKLGHVTVANAPGFGDKPLAELDGAEASVRVLPLLARQIEVGTVTLSDLHLRLTRHADGQSNWQGVVDHLSQDDSTAGSGQGASVPAENPAQPSMPLSDLSVGAIKITGAAVDWDDQADHAHYVLDDLNVNTGRLTDGAAFRLEFGGNLHLPDQGLVAHINTVSSIEPHLTDRFYRFASLSVNVLLKGASIPGGKQEANLSAAGEVDMMAGRFSLDDFTLQTAGATVTGKVSGDGLNNKLAYNGRLTVEPFSPRSAMQQMEIDPPKTQQESALTSASFDAQFEGGANRIRFKQVKATLDDSTLAGTARIEPITSPHIFFDLSLDKLDVDDYLPPGSAEQAKTSQPPETGGGSAQKNAEFDLSALRALHLDGRLKIGRLTAANIKVSNASVTLAANDGALKVDPLTAELYGGRLDMTAGVNAKPARPTFALAGSLKNLQVQPLLQDMANSQRLSASGSAQLDLKADGKQVAQLKRSLSGTASFDLRDGEIHGVSLAALLAAARRRLDAGKSEHSKAIGPGQTTVFSRFGGHFKINDGVMSGDDLALVTAKLRGQGAGQYDVSKNKLDYILTAKVPDDARGTLADLAGVGVPVRLTGPLLAPDYRLDVAAALKSAAGAQLKAHGKELQGKINKKIRDKTGDSELGRKVQQGLSNFLGGDKKHK